MRKLICLLALFAACGAASVSVSAQTLDPQDVTRIYRHSFTVVYELTGPEPVREAALSPDSTLVGFVRNNDLFVRNLRTGVETRLTHDGERNRIINGATDWVYEEEYGFTRAWEFSPDSRSVAFLRFDESRVREFQMMRYDRKLYPEPYIYKYPKAGEENSVVTLHVHDLATGRARTVKTDAYYIPRLGWIPPTDGRDGQIFFYRVNRLQNHFEVVLGDGRVIYSETSPTYVERPDDKTVTFLPDGEHFSVRNETRTGWWVEDLWHVERGFVRELSREERAPDLAEWNARVTDGREFVSFELPCGTPLYGWVLRPADFDPAKKYPVLMSQYSGPGSVSVLVPAIGRGDMAIFEPLLEAGYVVACFDGRGTGGRGEEFKKTTYGQLGRFETDDQIAAARYLAAQEWVDPERIGIWGWSFGGFVALNAILKGADVFSTAVAVAPVTSWRFYDTIYTETYNGLPADNPSGYDDNSPLNYAHLLEGNLLMIHGTGDDNVHVQNTLEMARALVEAGKQFDMMTYTDDNHSMIPSGSTHVRKKIVQYIKENL